MPTPRLTPALPALCLMASCATSSPGPVPERVVTVDRAVPILPPEEPPEPCPVGEPETIGALLEAMAAALRCEASERAVRRAWRERMAETAEQESAP